MQVRVLSRRRAATRLDLSRDTHLFPRRLSPRGYTIYMPWQLLSLPALQSQFNSFATDYMHGIADKFQITCNYVDISADDVMLQVNTGVLS